MVLSTNTHLCKTSGSKSISHLRNLNVQKWVNLLQMLLEVDETLNNIKHV